MLIGEASDRDAQAKRNRLRVETIENDENKIWPLMLIWSSVEVELSWVDWEDLRSESLTTLIVVDTLESLESLETSLRDFRDEENNWQKSCEVTQSLLWAFELGEINESWEKQKWKRGWLVGLPVSKESLFENWRRKWRRKRTREDEEKREKRVRKVTLLIPFQSNWVSDAQLSDWEIE